MSPRAIWVALLLATCPGAMACMEESVSGTVRFERNSTVFPDELNDVVAQIIHKARQYPTRPVLVRSYVDHKSEEVVANAKGATGTYARALGERRGERVKSRLVMNGFNHKMISVETLTSPQKDCNDTECRENRVEIRLLPTPVDMNAAPPEPYVLAIDNKDFKGSISLLKRTLIRLPVLNGEGRSWEIKEAFSRKREEEWAPLTEMPTQKSPSEFLLWPIPDEMLIVFVRKDGNGQVRLDDTIQTNLRVFNDRPNC
jgi:hypothetical protein